MVIGLVFAHFAHVGFVEVLDVADGGFVVECLVYVEFCGLVEDFLDVGVLLCADFVVLHVFRFC